MVSAALPSATSLGCHPAERSPTPKWCRRPVRVVPWRSGTTPRSGDRT